MKTLSFARRSVAVHLSSRESAHAYARHFIGLLEKRSISCVVLDGEAADPKLLERADLLVSIGGDGTLLRAARRVVDLGIPILGINTGRLGFLTEFDSNDPRIEDLPDLLDRGLLIEERVALQVEVCGKKHFALNDVVVRKGDIARVVPFRLHLDDEEAVGVPADGICVCTPTGSTAYFLSAGGSLISPRVDAFGVVPLLPHTLFSRPLIVAGDARVTIFCDADLGGAHLECDGDVVTEIAPNEPIVVYRYPRLVRFARVEALRFFERLEAKLRWGASIVETVR